MFHTINKVLLYDCQGNVLVTGISRHSDLSTPLFNPVGVFAQELVLLKTQQMHF